MVLKQSRRLTRYVCTHPETWYRPLRLGGGSLTEAEISSSISSTAPTLCSTSASCQCFVSPASADFDRQPGRRRRAPGRSSERLPAATRTFFRELSTSSRALQYDLKPEVPHCEGRKLFFDTNAVVQLLEKNGFNTLQAEVVVQVLMRMTNSNMDVIYCDLVTKVQQEIMLQRIMSQIAAVKKDMIILEKSEFSALLAENEVYASKRQMKKQEQETKDEKLKIQILLLKVQLADVMNKVRSGNILDMNVEKSRAKELKAEHEKKLLVMRTEILEMTAEQDRHLTQTNMKIDTEVAGLKTMLESHKLDTIKYLAGSVFTCLTVVLGFYRVWM